MDSNRLIVNNINTVNDEDYLSKLLKLARNLVRNGQSIEAKKYYQTIIETSEVVDNKKFKVLALCKIASMHLFNGETDIATKHMEMAEEILKLNDFTEGNLEVYLLKIQLYYDKLDYIKIRELGNEALKLCGEKHYDYKGWIYLNLIEAFSQITEFNEHIQMLQQALESFEKSDDWDGTLIVLNNLASAYADKAQDNEKALEYYLKLKEESENRSISVYSALAYINIGEIYLKTFNYEKAFYFLKKGCEKAKNENIERLAFYACCQLIENCIKLCNFQDAFSYYESAKKVLQNHPDQGPWLIYYYKSASMLMLEFASMDDSKKNIKKALEIADNDNSVIKWNTGYVYELVKLRLAKDDTDLTNGLEAVKFILSQYKDSELLLDKAYDYAIELIHLGQASYSLEFLDNYKNLKYKNELLKLKHLYIRFLTLSNNYPDKYELLIEAIDAAADTNDKKVQYGIYICAACYFDSIGDLTQATVYHSISSDILADLVSTVPDEYKLSFSTQYENQRITIENLFSPKYKL